MSTIPGMARTSWSVLATAIALFPAFPPAGAQAGRRPAGPTSANAAKSAAAPSTIDAELKEALKSAPKAADWPNSNHATLLDLADITVKPDGTVVADYRESHKLFNERARDMAEVDLPYNSSYQSVKVLRARTIKKNGQVLDVNPADIRTSSTFSDYPMYDDAMTVGFSMPGIEDDCVIDYSYRIVTRPILLKGHFWQHWTFSQRGPVWISKLVLHHPTGCKIQAKVYNDDTIKPASVIAADGKTATETWAMRNIKPIEPEPSMPDPVEAGVWMEITSIPTWQEIARWFWDLAKPQTAPSAQIKATVAKLIEGKQTDEDKARAIYDWVSNRVRYVALEFGLSAFRPHAAPDVYTKLYGDCKDKATLLVSMLGLAGIKANPVLLDAGSRVKTRDHLPTLNSFDHCIAIAVVGGKEIWLDPTAETCAFGDIPGDDRGSDALIVREGQCEFKMIPEYGSEENGGKLRLDISLRPDGSADLKAQVTVTGAHSQEMRASFRSITPEQRKQVGQALAQAFATGATIKESAFPPATDKEGPCKISISLSAPKWAKKAGSLLLVPIISGSLQIGRNPYTADKRVWPIVIQESSRQEGETVVTLPDGYIAEDIPTDSDIKSALGEFQRTVRKSDDGKQLIIKVSTLTLACRVPAGDYAKVKTYYDDIAHAFDDPIVVKKAAQASRSK